MGLEDFLGGLEDFIFVIVLVYFRGLVHEQFRSDICFVYYFYVLYSKMFCPIHLFLVVLFLL